MKNKYFFLSFLGVLILVGGGCRKIDLPNNLMAKEIGQDFFQKHCQYIFEKSPDMLAGWANNVDECIKKYIAQEAQVEVLCKTTKNDCDASREKRINSYREAVTQKGCLKAQTGVKCGFWDITQQIWQQAPADQRENAKKEFTKCMAEGEAFCSVFRDHAPY